MITRILIGLILALGLLAIWQRGSLANAQRTADAAEAARDAAQAELVAANAALGQAHAVIDTERRNAAKANALAAQYEQEKADAQAASDRLVADLRAGNERLHQRWQAAVATAGLSATAAAASFADGGADDRFHSAGRIVGAADRCDAQVIALQAFARLCSTPASTTATTAAEVIHEHRPAVDGTAGQRGRAVSDPRISQAAAGVSQ